mmetsp:Transcript_269/g.573  ORF Transcript_269/g.573 Transcript_269/m.573 type:complete len:207 (+) Transcript_269:562-1182(+)
MRSNGQRISQSTSQGRNLLHLRPQLPPSPRLTGTSTGTEALCGRTTRRGRGTGSLGRLTKLDRQQSLGINRRTLRRFCASKVRRPCCCSKKFQMSTMPRRGSLSARRSLLKIRRVVDLAMPSLLPVSTRLVCVLKQEEVSTLILVHNRLFLAIQTMDVMAGMPSIHSNRCTPAAVYPGGACPTWPRTSEEEDPPALMSAALGLTTQ